MPSCWAAGATTGVVLEGAAKTVQVPPLQPGQMHPFFKGQAGVGKTTRAREMLVGHIHLEQLVGGSRNKVTVVAGSNLALISIGVQLN